LDRKRQWGQRRQGFIHGIVEEGQSLRALSRGGASKKEIGKYAKKDQVTFAKKSAKGEVGSKRGKAGGEKKYKELSWGFQRLRRKKALMGVGGCDIRLPENCVKGNRKCEARPLGERPAWVASVAERENRQEGKEKHGNPMCRAGEEG